MFAHSRSHRLSIGALCLVIVWMLWAQLRPVAAAAITAQVVPFADALNGADGKCSLSEAVIAANINTNAHEPACIAGQPAPSIDQISIPAGTHYALDPTINDQTALFISETVTITGAGVTTIIAPGADDNALPTDGQFSANDTHGFFILADGITIQDLTIDGLGNAALGSGIEFRTGIVSNALPLDDLTIQNVTIQNVRRRGMNIAAGTNVNILNNTVQNLETGLNGVGIVLFAAAANADVLLNGNVVTNFGNGIATNSTGAASNSGLFTIEANTVSNLQPITLPVVSFSYGLLMGGSRDGSTLDGNTVTLTDDGALDIAVYASRNLEASAGTPGTVTISANTLQVAGADTGIVLYRNGLIGESAFNQKLRVFNNIIAGDATSSAFLNSTGVYVTDDSTNLFTTTDPRPQYAEIDTNTITGFYRAIHVRRAGVSGTYPTGQPVAAVIDANDLLGGTIGLDVEGHAAGGAALVTTADGDNRIEANSIGVQTSANASATLGSGTAGECLIANTTFGAQNGGGALTLSNTWWGSSAGPGVAANGTNGSVTTTPFAVAPIIRLSTSQPCQPSYGNYVWYDTDSDSVQDAGEPGAEGVMVNVYDATGTTLLGSLPTGANGLYRVGRSGAANTVLEIDPALTLVTALQGGNPALDSNFSPANNRVTVSPNGIDDSIDAGIVPTVGLLVNRTSAAGLSITDDVSAVTEGTTVGDQLAIRLGSQPSANVTIQIAVDSPAQLRISTAAAPQTLLISFTVTFEPVDTMAAIPDWDEWVVVNVGALADGAAEGVHSSNLTLSVVAGGAAEYNAMPNVAEVVTIYEPGILIAPYTPNPMQEGGTALYSVSLSAPPGLRTTGGGVEAVTLNLVGYNIRFVVPTQTQLTFTRTGAATDWNQPQIVNLTAPNDTVQRGVRYLVTIFHQPTTNVLSPLDSYYGGAPTVIANGRQRITIYDNDLMAVPALSPDTYDALNAAAWLDGVVAVAPLVEGISDTVVSVRLSGQPAAGDSVTLTVASVSGVSLVPSSLLFTYHNWDVYQPITVTVPADLITTGMLPIQVSVAETNGETTLDFEGAAIALEVQIISAPVAPLVPSELPASGVAPGAENGAAVEGTISE